MLHPFIVGIPQNLFIFFCRNPWIRSLSYSPTHDSYIRTPVKYHTGRGVILLPQVIIFHVQLNPGG